MNEASLLGNPSLPQSFEASDDISATSAGDILQRFFDPLIVSGGRPDDAVGNAKAPSLADLAALPRPCLPNDKQTPMMLLLPPLRALARHLSPNKIIVDCGGQGQCGPNAVAFLLPFVDKAAVDGLQLRAMVVAHAARKSVQESFTLVKRSTRHYFTIAQFIVDCMEKWPEHQRTHEEPSVHAWCEAMARPQTWADAAFLQVVADLFSIAVHVTSVDSLGLISQLGYLMPSLPSKTTAVIEIGCWPHHHFVAIGNVPPNAAALQVDDGYLDDTTLTTVKQVRLYSLNPTDHQCWSGSNSQAPSAQL